jgi:photosystem II stability/assembly factor-like uncharacterized protein
MRTLSTLLLITLTVPAQSQELQWQPMVADLLKSEKTGFGGLCGMVVDHSTGQIWINLSDRGFFTSTDQAKTFKRVSETQPKGRTEWPGCLMFDPTGGKIPTIVTALVYGSPISISNDRGQTWKYMDKASSHVDWCAVDWSDPEMKFVFALKHESGDLLIVSHDGGKSFTEVGKGYGPAWIFDNKTAVIAEARSKTKPKPGLLRTTDGGKTFQPAGEFSTRALPKWFDEQLYWLVEGALIATKDKGETWKKLGDIKDGQYGPIFGKDSKQMFVLTKTGIVESTDGGASWSKPIALPKGFRVENLTWIDYDPKNDVLYLMKMTTDLYKLERGK